MAAAAATAAKPPPPPQLSRHLMIALSSPLVPSATDSKFRVGASILLNDGSLVQGANIENASYGAGVCAERTALLTAIATSFPRSSTSSASSMCPLTGAIQAIAVSSDLSSDPCSPCGICRQFIREFAALDTPIFMVWKQWKGGAVTDEENRKVMTSERGGNCYDEEGVVVRTLEELLPLSFGPDELTKI